MDTNLVNAIVSAVHEHGGQSQGSALAITILIITSFGGLIASLVTYIKAKATHLAAEDAKIVSKTTAGNIQKIEVSVNSRSERMENTIKEQTKKIEELNLLLSALQEKRLEEVKKSLKQPLEPN